MGWFKRLLGEEDTLPKVKATKKRAKRRDFSAIYPLDATVGLLVKRNPKRRGTAARVLYDKYEHCSTIDDCFRAGMTYRILDGDVQRGYIEVIKCI